MIDAYSPYSDIGKNLIKSNLSDCVINMYKIELANENDEIELPSWIGEEVTNDSAYLNVNLFKGL
jgi:CYTH domain-containing protein